MTEEGEPKNIVQEEETVETRSSPIIIDHKIEVDNENKNKQQQQKDDKEINKDNKSQLSEMRNFYVIASGYLLFTLTDSALRMIVLLELFTRQYNALQISFMFVLYEFIGALTNLFGGIMGSRLGLRFCLLVGLAAQVIGISILCGLQADWDKAVVIVYIVIAQGFSGIAKDLVKIGGKSVTKLVTNDGEKSRLFKLVAWLTGAKNSVKGFGFFWGAFLLYFIQYIPSLIILLLMNLIVIPPAWFYLDRDLGVSKSKKRLTLKQIFSKGRDVNILSIARMFLFGARDLWFEVPLPLFIRREPINWSYISTGAFLAGWVIFYGFVQSGTPQLILKPIKQYPLKSGRILVPATFLLLVLSASIAIGLTVVQLTLSNAQNYVTLLLVIMLVGLFLFAFIFAINSSIHSFLILAYCKRDKVTVNIGFYYMANALGRLLGLIIGGLLFYYLDFYACLWASVVSLGFCIIISHFLGPIPQSNENVS